MSNESMLGGVTVLLVEDDVDTRCLLELAFAKQGATVLAAEDGFKAISIMQTIAIDILVSDLGLPGLNGYDLIRKIRALEREKISGVKAITPVPAIAVSAYVDAESKRRAIEAGFQIHISKPANIPGLLAAVGGLMKKRTRR